MGQQETILLIVLGGALLTLVVVFMLRVRAEGLERALVDAINAASRWGREVGVVAGPMLMELLLDTFELWLPEKYLRWIDLLRGAKTRREWLHDALQRLFDRSTFTKEILSIQGPPAAAINATRSATINAKIGGINDYH